MDVQTYKHDKRTEQAKTGSPNLNSAGGSSRVDDRFRHFVATIPCGQCRPRRLIEIPQWGVFHVVVVSLLAIALLLLVAIDTSQIVDEEENRGEEEKGDGEEGNDDDVEDTPLWYLDQSSWTALATWNSGDEMAKTVVNAARAAGRVEVW